MSNLLQTIFAEQILPALSGLSRAEQEIQCFQRGIDKLQLWLLVFALFVCTHWGAWGALGCGSQEHPVSPSAPSDTHEGELGVLQVSCCCVLMKGVARTAGRSQRCSGSCAASLQDPICVSPLCCPAWETSAPVLGADPGGPALPLPQC